jgi:hypothetical protein
MRSYTPPRNNQTQLRVGVCALLLLPLALGAAFYSMLAAPDDDTARPAGPVAGAQAARPIAVASEADLAESRSSLSATGAPQETVGRSAEDEAQIPTSVQIAAPSPAAVNPPALDVDGAPSVKAPQPAPWEVSMALLPRVLTSSGQVLQQTPQPRMPAVQMSAEQGPVAQARPAANLSSAESPPAAPVVRKRVRPRYLANLARRNGARSETAAAGRSIQPQAFSLKEWLEQQLGTRPRNSGG